MMRTFPTVPFILTLIFMLRVFGLMMILPVISHYGALYASSTPFLIAWVVGIYGLAQALLQFPLGVLSDKIGRKKVLLFGLVLLLLGSIIGMLSDSVYGLIAARMIQGSGAIGSVVMALIADHTSTQHRTLAMAFFGMMVGCSFFLALIVSPIIGSSIGLRGIFACVAACAAVSIMAVTVLIPNDVENACKHNRFFWRNGLSQTLWPLYYGIWAIHTLYTAWFLAVPRWLTQYVGLPLPQHSMFYLKTLLPGACIAGAMLFYVERNKQPMLGTLGGAVGFLLAVLLVDYDISASTLYYALIFFFAGFCYFESILPSKTSKQAPQDIRGTVMGVFSSCQFLGIFSGSVLTNMLTPILGAHTLTVLFFSVLLLWAYLVMRTSISRKFVEVM